jgi:hypothetical protein
MESNAVNEIQEKNRESGGENKEEQRPQIVYEE